MEAFTENFYYVPSFFKACKPKNGSPNIVTVKAINGNYIGDSLIKKLTGFHAKDTGRGQEDIIAREITNTIVEYPNDWYEGISLTGKKKWNCHFKQYVYELQHSLGFNFYIRWNELETFVIDQKISIINGVFQSKFKFAIDYLDKVILISEKCTEPIKTESDVINLKQCIQSIKADKLKIGSVYDLYASIDPTVRDYTRIVYLGKIEHSKWLLEGDYARLPRYIEDYPYYVFIELETKSYDGYYNENEHTRLTPYIGPEKVILMKNISRRIRSLDSNQNIEMYKISDGSYTESIPFDELLKRVNNKINYWLNNKNSNETL